MNSASGFRDLMGDLKASIVVFLVALPLCLGIALASGAPLLSGVLAGIIGGIVIGIISDSRTSVSGPAAGLTVIVFTAIGSLGSFYDFTLAVLIGGCMQMAMGAFGAGRLGGYFPNSVIKGMLAAIGLILILKQIPHAVGFDRDFMGDEGFFQFDGENTFSGILMALQAFHPGAAVVALLSLVLMVAWEKLAGRDIGFFQAVPGALVAVILGVVINEKLLSFDPYWHITSDHLVRLPVSGGFASLFESFQMPNWSGWANPKIYLTATTIAIVASLESLLSVEAVDKIDPLKRRTDKSRELLAQGAGNALAGLVGALPMTSVIVRSSANVNAGGKTRAAAILHGLWLLLAVALFPSILQRIPLATLAAILILVGYKLCKPSLFKEMAEKGRSQIIPFAVTVVAILFTDLLVGICIGIVAGFFFVLRSNAKKSIVVVNDGKYYLIRFMKDVSFLQKPRILSILNQLPNGANVVVDGSNHVYVDADIEEILEEFLASAKDRKIQVEFAKSTLALSDFFKE